MTKKEFNDGVKESSEISVNRCNKFLGSFNLSLFINWEYDFDGELGNAIGVYEGGSVFSGEISIGMNMVNLRRYIMKSIKSYPWSDGYTILDEAIQTNVYHEMGHGLVELIGDYLRETDELDGLYDDNQELFDYIFDNEEDAVEEFAWRMYENRLGESELYKVIELYLSLYNEGIMENRIDRFIRESIEDYFNDLNSMDELTPWDSETKMDRMKPINAHRSRGSVPTRDYGVIRGYKDWKENFENVMKYPEYCKRFGLRR